jgi:hypothetical protein
MSEQKLTTTGTKPVSKDNLTTGIILIVIGVGLLIFRLVSLEGFFPLALGLIFIIAGILKRSAGLIIPGGIIGGAGLGTVAMMNNWLAPMGSAAGGGVFLLVMSLGWFSITLLSKLFTDETQVWALFPGAAMALIGGLVLMGEQGLRVLEVMGTYWPLILVAVGMWVLYGVWKNRG